MSDLAPKIIDQTSRNEPIKNSTSIFASFFDRFSIALGYQAGRRKSQIIEQPFGSPAFKRWRRFRIHLRFGFDVDPHLIPFWYQISPTSNQKTIKNKFKCSSICSLILHPCWLYVGHFDFQNTVAERYPRRSWRQPPPKVAQCFPRQL